MPYVTYFVILLFNLSKVLKETLQAGLANNAMLLLLKALGHSEGGVSGGF